MMPISAPMLSVMQATPAIKIGRRPARSTSKMGMNVAKKLTIPTSAVSRRAVFS